MNPGLPEDSTSKPTIWVDADACPKAIKEILIRTSKRLSIQLIFVANQSIHAPASKLIQVLTVRDGADIADNHIVESMTAGDLVITQDIPLAARVVEKGGLAIGVRGDVYEDGSIQSRLGSRNLMEQLRSADMETAGPKPFKAKDVQTFANALDRTLTKAIRQKGRKN